MMPTSSNHLFTHLRRLGDRFVDAADRHRVSTTVTRARVGDLRHARGPEDHWLRDATGIGRPSANHLIIRVPAADGGEELRGVFFGGGDAQGLRLLMRLAEQAGGILLEIPPARWLPLECNRLFRKIDGKGRYSAAMLRWHFWVHHVAIVGPTRWPAVPLQAEVLTWDDDDPELTLTHEAWRDGDSMVVPAYYLSHIADMFEASAHAIDVLLAELDHGGGHAPNTNQPQRRKPVPPQAWTAFFTAAGTSMTQAEIADMMTETLKPMHRGNPMRYSAGHVSRWLKQVREHLAAGGLPMDPQDARRATRGRRHTADTFDVEWCADDSIANRADHGDAGLVDDDAGWTSI